MPVSTSEILKLLVPKGRMETTLINSFRAAGLNFEKAASRSLFYTSKDIGVQIIPLKSQDIITYMDKGLANLAIIGEDLLDENIPDGRYCDLAQLTIGQCRMSLAGYPDFALSKQDFLRIASKYPLQAQQVLQNLGIKGEVIPLTSSVELAPILGFADAILDIVETGATLKDNGLVEWFPLKPICSKVISPALQDLTKVQRTTQQILLNALPIKYQEVGYALCS